MKLSIRLLNIFVVVALLLGAIPAMPAATAPASAPQGALRMPPNPLFKALGLRDRPVIFAAVAQTATLQLTPEGAILLLIPLAYMAAEPWIETAVENLQGGIETKAAYTRQQIQTISGAVKVAIAFASWQVLYAEIGYLEQDATHNVAHNATVEQVERHINAATTGRGPDGQDVVCAVYRVTIGGIKLFVYGRIFIDALEDGGLGSQWIFHLPQQLPEGVARTVTLFEAARSALWKTAQNHKGLSPKWITTPCNFTDYGGLPPATP